MLGTFDTGTLKPGETVLLEVSVPGDFRTAKTLVIGAVGNNEKFEKTEIQSECLLEIPAGQFMVTEDEYRCRGLEQDRWTVKVSSLGPEVKRGTAVFYNSETLEVYERFETELDPLKSDTFTIESKGEWLDDKYPNLAFRILPEGEELDDAQPAGMFIRTGLIPLWAKDRTKIDYFSGDNSSSGGSSSDEGSQTTAAGTSPVSSGSYTASKNRQSVVNTADVNHPARDAAILCISLILAALSAAVLERERRRAREP